MFYLYFIRFLYTLCIIYLLNYFFNNTRYKKLSEQTIKNNIEKSKKYKRVAIDRDRYSSRKIPDNLDAIIIGSGIGGLSCGGFFISYGKESSCIRATLYCWWNYAFI